MSEETVPQEIFIYKLKIAAMLHDPPDKAWHVAGKKRLGHEEVSSRIKRELSLELGEICEQRAKHADTTAAGADRWFAEIFSALVSRYTQRIVLVNPFSLELREPIEPQDEYPYKWVKEMENIKNYIWRLNLPDEEKYKWFYHFLYALGEPLYYKCYPCSVSPADTRMPHHTVFDHLSVTASLSNWFIMGEQPRGLLVQLELAGVQKYIECSRKLCDMWFSSFLFSYIAWSLVEELVERLGPDVLLSPSCRWNPFYFRWLRKNAEVKNLSQNLIDFLEDTLMLEKPLPILPTSLRLILPPFEVLKTMRIGSEKGLVIDSEEKLVEYFVARYREVYGNLVWLVREECQDEKIRKALEQVSGVPPLPLRCAIVRVPEEVEEEVEKCFENFQKALEHAGVLDEKTKIVTKNDFYPYVALRKLACKFSRSEQMKAKGILAVNFQKWTEECWSNGKGFTYCTVCGEVPSIFHVESKEEIGIFDEGEHLCEYCLVKRLAATQGRVRFLEELGFKEAKISTPTVDWQAIYPLIEDLTDPEKGQKLAQELEKRMEELESDVRGPLEKILKGEFTKNGMRRSYVGGGRDAIPEIRQILEPQDIENLLRKDIGGKYFALIQADADNMGYLLHGELGKIKGLLEKEKEEDFFVKIVSKTGEYGKEELDKFRELIGKCLQSMREKDEKETQKLWPSLLSAVSRALVLSALNDARTALRVAPEACTLVYAGGDDLLVVAPVSYALKLVEETRRNFSEGSGNTFTSIEANGEEIAFLPTLGKSSRSYSVIISHYRTPLSLALERAREGLDEAKATETISADATFEKDCLFLEYRSRGGAGACAILPISLEYLDYLRVVEEVLKLIQDGKLSNSFIYDLREVCEKYDMAGCVDCEEIGSLVQDAWKRNKETAEMTEHLRKFSEILGKERVLEAAKVKLKKRTRRQDKGHSLLLAVSRALYVASISRRGRE
jgi:CRISPR-associated protein Cmr2